MSKTLIERLADLDVAITKARVKGDKPRMIKLRKEHQEVTLAIGRSQQSKPSPKSDRPSEEETDSSGIVEADDTSEGDSKDNTEGKNESDSAKSDDDSKKDKKKKFF